MTGSWALRRRCVAPACTVLLVVGTVALYRQQNWVVQKNEQLAVALAATTNSGGVVTKRPLWNATHFNEQSKKVQLAPTASKSGEDGLHTADYAAWCILHENNTGKYFQHFPHTMQSISPCWSYFCRVRERYPHAQCGLHVTGTLDWHLVDLWARVLVEYTGCQVVHQNSKERLPIFGPHAEYPELDSSFRPWFERPIDAWLLKQHVLKHATNDMVRRPGTLGPIASGNVKIGIVIRPWRDRPPNRTFLNLDEIRSALQTALPLALISVVDMGNLTMLEQAVYFSQQDIVIAAHGAALTNAMFLRVTNDTSPWYNDDSNSSTMTAVGATTLTAAAVVEVFPDDWEKRMFQQLMRSCGNDQHYSIFRNTSVHRSASKSSVRVPDMPRNVDLLPNVTLLVELVQTALRKKQLR
jgi:Glycosyltransferase 61